MGALLFESDDFTVVACVSNGERKCHRGIFLPVQKLRTHEFQQGEVAEYLGVSRALLSKWIRTGLLKPTGTPSGKQRAYTVDDVIRAVIARTLMKDLGFGFEVVQAVVELIRRDDRDELRRAHILTARTRPGMMRHIFVDEGEADLADIADNLDIENFSGTFGQLVRRLKRQDRYIDVAPLAQIVEACRQEGHEQQLIRQRSAEAS